MARENTETERALAKEKAEADKALEEKKLVWRKRKLRLKGPWLKEN